MAAHIIIDGYNFLGASAGRAGLAGEVHGDLEGARGWLLDRLSEYRKSRRVRMTVVFDGTRSGRLERGAEKHGSVSVVYSRDGEEADDVIKRMAHESRGATVVTSDKELASYLKGLGVVVISSGEFSALVEEAEYEKIKGVTPEDEDDRGPGFGRKKGPSRRPSKGERKKRGRIKKL